MRSKAIIHEVPIPSTVSSWVSGQIQHILGDYSESFEDQILLEFPFIEKNNSYIHPGDFCVVTMSQDEVIYIVLQLYSNSYTRPYFWWKTIQNMGVFRINYLQDINIDAIKYMRDNFTHKFFCYYDDVDDCWIIAFTNQDEFTLFTLMA